MKWHLLLGLGISAACLIWLLAEVNMALLWHLVSHLNPLYPLMVAVLLAANFYLRSLRWRVLLAPIKPCPVGELYSANLIGFMANNILPARLGEFVRAYAAARLTGVAASSALATLVIERILDGMTILAFFFLALLFTDPTAHAGAFSVAYLRAVGLGLLAIYLGVLAVLVALYRWPAATVGWLASLVGHFSPRLGERARQVLGNFNQGLALLGRSKHLPLLLAQSVGMWLISLLAIYLFLPAMGLPHNLLLAAMALAGATLAASVPAGPGYIGTTQLAMLWTMMMVGADHDRAASFSLVFWACGYFPVVAAGLIEMTRRGLSLSSLRRGGTAGSAAG